MKNFIKKNRYRLMTVCILMVLVSATAQEIKWHSIDTGGGVSTDNFGVSLLGVIGQADTIRMTGGDISLSAGYLPLPVKADPIFKNSFE